MASHYMQWYVLLSLGRVTPLHCFDMYLDYICSICVLKCMSYLSPAISRPPSQNRQVHACVVHLMSLAH